jgi:thioredoxin-like negative regulator of GroEL
MLQKVSAEEIKINEEKSLVYFYTPFCGTCAQAEKMLELALEALPGLTVFACNINFAPEKAKQWRIESVPCLICFNQGKIDEKVYAFRSVSYIYEFLNQKI